MIIATFKISCDNYFCPYRAVRYEVNKTNTSVY